MPDNRQRTLAHHSDPIFWKGLCARSALAIFLIVLKAGIQAAIDGSIVFPTLQEVVGALLTQYLATYLWYRLVRVLQRQADAIRRQRAEIARLRLHAPQK